MPAPVDGQPESIEAVGEMHPLVAKALAEIEEQRGEGGGQWGAQGLSELVSNGTIREQAQLSPADWRRVEVAARAHAAAEFQAERNIQATIYQLRVLEDSGAVTVDLVTNLWREAAARLDKPKRSDAAATRRVEHFLRELVLFVRRTRPDADAHAEVVDMTRAAKTRVKVTPELLAQVDAQVVAQEPGERPGLEGRFWRGDRDELDKLARSKKPRHEQVFDYSTRDGGQLHWELGEGHRPEGLGTPPFVGRMQGVLALPPGAYRLHIKCDDAVRMHVAGSIVFDTWRHAGRDSGKYWHRWLSRDVWLDARNAISIDTWDGGNAHNLTLSIDQRQPNGGWKRVPFELFHVPGRR